MGMFSGCFDQRSDLSKLEDECVGPAPTSPGLDTFYGVVYDESSHEPIGGAHIRATSERASEPLDVYTDSNGCYSVMLARVCQVEGSSHPCFHKWRCEITKHLYEYTQVCFFTWRDTMNKVSFAMTKEA